MPFSKCHFLDISKQPKFCVKQLSCNIQCFSPRTPEPASLPGNLRLYSHMCDGHETKHSSRAKRS